MNPRMHEGIMQPLSNLSPIKQHDSTTLLGQLIHQLDEDEIYNNEKNLFNVYVH